MRQDSVILLSGGLDSTTTLAIALNDGFRPAAMTVSYGQRHLLELEAAKRVADHYRVPQRIVSVDLRAFGGSALTSTQPIPKRRRPEEIGTSIPPTYVPARNTILLSLALAFAETLSVETIFIGVTEVDASGYPDCRPEFVSAFEDLARLATKKGAEGRGLRVKAPLLHKSKPEIIRIGMQLGVNYKLTSSCYDPSETGLACGHCDACVLRLKGFRENHMQDPIDYINPI